MKRGALSLVLGLLLLLGGVQYVSAFAVVSQSQDIVNGNIIVMPYLLIGSDGKTRLVFLYCSGTQDFSGFTLQLENGTVLTQSDFVLVNATMLVDNQYNQYFLLYEYNGILSSATLTSVNGISVSIPMSSVNYVKIDTISELSGDTTATFDINEGNKFLIIGGGTYGGSFVSGFTIDGIAVSQGFVEGTDDDGTLTFADSSANPFSAVIVQVSTAVTVTFSLKDALTGQSLSDVTVKEGDTILGIIDDGGSLELTKGTHTLTFEKDGYWSVTKTIDVQSDMNVSVEMYPDSAAFLLENFPSDIQVYESSIYELTFTLSPISTQATYNTYLSLSGLSDVLEVRKDGQTISPESGKYYLGDISGDTQITIKFKAGSVGTHSFTITLTSNDAIMSQTYTTSKQVVYEVIPLPFSVQMPSEWTVGTNEVRVSESSGQNIVITAVLKDSQGNEVWSDSHAFSPYEAYAFQVNVPAEGSYTLEFQFLSTVAVFDVQVNPTISLVTKQITVSEGGEGTITLHFNNPSSDVKYYTIILSGGFLPAEINQTVSIAPLTEKDVSIAFAVPNDLTYDAYEINVAVYDGDALVFTDKVAVTLDDDSGFSLIGGSGDNSWLWIIGGLIIVGLIFWLRR